MILINLFNYWAFFDDMHTRVAHSIFTQIQMSCNKHIFLCLIV